MPADDGLLAFVALPPPTDQDVAALALKVARRLTTVVERHCDDTFETDALLAETAAALQQALAVAVRAPVPRTQLSLGGQDDPQPATKPLCARVAGFSLHAAQSVPAEDREALERLCRYGLRPAFAQERLALREDGRVLYHLRRPWPHAAGPTCLVLEPLDFLRRLAALIPAPYAHMVRYHGCFANRSRARDMLPAPPAPVEAELETQSARTQGPATRGEGCAPADGAPTAEIPAPARRRPLPWAQLLLRVFFVQALKCPRCAGAMVILAFLSDPPVVAKVLHHLRLPTAPPPLTPARRARGTGTWGSSAPLALPPEDATAVPLEPAETWGTPRGERTDRDAGGARIRPPP